MQTESQRITAEDLYGTWRLVGSRAVDASGSPRRDPWGPEPMGVLVLDRSGRMLAVLCDGRATITEGERRQYSSYCGTFQLDGDLLTTTVDAASDPSRIGSKQPRRLVMRGERLVLLPPPGPDGEQREIYWERIAPAPPQ